MTLGSFDEPALQKALRAYVAASIALEQPLDDAEFIEHSNAKTMASMALRKRLVELGWSAPERQRTST